MSNDIVLLKTLLLSTSQRNIYRHTTDKKKRRRIVANVIGFAFLYVLIVYGAEFTALVSTMYYSYIYMPQSYVVSAIPVSAVIMTLMNIENFIVDAKKLCGKTAACEGGAQ